MFNPSPQDLDKMKEQAAIALLRIASIFQANEKAEWVKGPPRSVPGEHLHIDTSNARDKLIYTPTDPKQVKKTLEVAVGYRDESTWYPGWWSDPARGSKRRLGLADKLDAFTKSGILGNIMGSYTP